MKQSKFAGRAGEKLEFALQHFKLNVNNLICADFGSAVGGFVGCLLSHGAQKIYAVETGYGVLNWELRNNSQVVVMERTNAMHVTLPEKVDLITIDTSWTKQKNTLPNALKNLKTHSTIITLIKPHYEAPNLLKSGQLSLTDAELVKDSIIQTIQALHLKVINVIPSPILGNKAHNIEYLALVKPK